MHVFHLFDYKELSRGIYNSLNLFTLGIIYYTESLLTMAANSVPDVASNAVLVKSEFDTTHAEVYVLYFFVVINCN